MFRALAYSQLTKMTKRLPHLTNHQLDPKNAKPTYRGDIKDDLRL